MKEQDIINTYQVLNHDKETEIRLIDPELDATKKKPPLSFFVNSKEEFLEICKKHEGQYNIYAGINERKIKGTDKKDVISVSTIVIDIDPIRPKGLERQASREEEIEEAKKIVDQILKTCREAGQFKKPSIAFSGNGFQLWIKIPKIEITDDNRDVIEQRIKHFQKLFQKKYDNNFVKIDQIGDLPRIIKVIGTKSIKGTPSLERPHRESYWVDLCPEIDQEVKNEIFAYILDEEEQLIRNYVEPDKKTLQQIRTVLSDKKYQRLFDGNVEGYLSRSEAEMSIVFKLVESEVPREQLFEIMKSCRIGKWNTTHPDYRELTYKKAVEFYLKIKQNKETGKEDEFSMKQLAWQTSQELLEQFSFISYGDKERNTVYIYEDGIYIPFGKQRIWKYLEQNLQAQATVTLKNEVFDNIYSSTLFDKLPEMPAELCCLENGVLNVLTRDFKPHSSEQTFFQKLPIKYEPTKICPQVEKFLQSIVKPEDLKTIQKWIGYCLLRDYRYASLLMLNGSGANGKSTFLRLIKMFLGPENVVSIPIQEIEEDPFSIISLKDKMANIFADLPSKALQTTSMLKGLTGEDNFSANQKFKERMSFVSYAKLMYSCNKLPSIPEDNEAIWRRLILIEFPNTFPREQQDVQLLKKLINPDELSGLLNYALEGLKQLLIANGFDDEVSKTREAYIRATDGIGSFVLDCLVKNPSNDIQKEQLYAEYVDYCEYAGYDVEFDNAFFRHLKTRISFIQTHPKMDGRQVHCVRGMDFKRCGICGLFFTHCNISECTNMKTHFKNVVMGIKKPAYPVHSSGKVHTNLENQLPEKNTLQSILSIIDFLKQQLQHIPSFTDIKEYTNLDETTLTNLLQQLKKEGQIYEPKPDNYETIK